ncbi:MAG: putative toxin-antitoxin system toxin component, PIN family [Ardenticatenia bacterium]|nr:putative toxin-antitoxin system toxin component, PIN family [Ardenticatenia bacterium]
MVSVVLDVNVIVSSVMSPRGAPRQVLAAWEAGEIDALTSDGIIGEVAEKLLDPRIGGRFNVSLADVQAVVLLLRTQARVVDPPSTVVVTGDPEDDHVLATAAHGRAEYLVTGDKGLLGLVRHGSTQIISPRAFLDLLNPRSA